MTIPYKRRRSAGLIHNFWIYRKLVLAAILMGLTLWFIIMNDTSVQVWFPFGFGPMNTTSGVAILLGALAGAVTTVLLGTVFLTIRRMRDPHHLNRDEDDSAIPEDRPPTDYAAKTPEGFQPPNWSA